MTPERTSRTGHTARVAALNVVVRGSAEVFGKVATFVWTIFAARQLTQGEFGAVSYALTLMLVLSALPNGGFEVGLVRQGSARPELLNRVFSQTQAWKSLLGVPVFGVAVLVTVLTEPSPTTALVVVLFLVAGFPEMWSSTLRSASTTIQKPWASSSALVLQRIVTAVLIVAVAWANPTPLGVAIGFCLGTFVGWVAHVVALRRAGVHLVPSEIHRAGLVDLLKDTWVVGISGMVLMALFRLDAILLQAMVGYEAVANYSVAYRILETVLFVTFSVNQAIFPVMSATTQIERIRNAYERGLAVIGFVYLPFATVCVVESGEVIQLLFGPRYVDSATPILQWLAPAPMFYAVAFFGAAVLYSRQRQVETLAAAVTATVVNVTANLLLIPRWEGTGAAVATSLSYLVHGSIILVAVRRAGIKVGVLRPLLESGVASVVLVLLLLALSTPLLVELALGGVVYLAVWTALCRVTAPEQLEVVGSLLNRVRSR
ncbi:flippase [Nocardioides marmoribigeumensis]|uniref:O-antigen/teichoic acid export membrane protein n=1 Tax=Nocardioides marmoribigeumensis TaxID=433649 RepID=A0ABU2BZI4_9ACTN|nr:flippase [Nocardioides marmoribigeumensis]MDR7363806.1 O-antigen/teichoic acid export membrane protein [Nocardioides marmoribigeumensis]